MKVVVHMNEGPRTKYMSIYLLLMRSDKDGSLECICIDTAVSIKVVLPKA